MSQGGSNEQSQRANKEPREPEMSQAPRELAMRQGANREPARSSQSQNEPGSH